MVGKSQEIFDSGSKHPGNEIADYEDRFVHAYVFFAVIAMFVVFWMMVVLGATNVIR